MGVGWVCGGGALNARSVDSNAHLVRTHTVAFNQSTNRIPQLQELWRVSTGHDTGNYCSPFFGAKMALDFSARAWTLPRILTSTPPKPRTPP